MKYIYINYFVTTRGFREQSSVSSGTVYANVDIKIKINVGFKKASTILNLQCLRNYIFSIASQNFTSNVFEDEPQNLDT